MSALERYEGGCHCGQVRFSVEVDPAADVLRCNCSMCRRHGFLHVIVPQSRFSLLQGSEALQLYKFGTGIARHLFCRNCGVESFYVPRSNPDGYSVHAACIEGFEGYAVVDIDGAGDWEGATAHIAHLSQES